jgi:beta-lactamase class D
MLKCERWIGQYLLLFLISLFGLFGGGTTRVLAKSACQELKLIDATRFSAEIGKRKMAFFAKDLNHSTCYTLSNAPSVISPHLRHTPWSTFKIPNLMIALETGVAPSLDYALPWDPQRRPRASYWPEDWAQTQTLASAFKRSAAWYFQDLSLKIGSENYRKWLKSFHYGNLNVQNRDDAFWLNHTLQISPVEQVDFLSALLTGQLKVSQKTIQALDQVAFLGTLSAKDTLYGKTGSGPLVLNHFDGAFEGWLVGYVKRQSQKPMIYALYVKGSNFKEIAKFRQQMSEAILKTLL